MYKKGETQTPSKHLEKIKQRKGKKNKKRKETYSKTLVWNKKGWTIFCVTKREAESTKETLVSLYLTLQEMLRCLAEVEVWQQWYNFYVRK